MKDKKVTFDNGLNLNFRENRHRAHRRGCEWAYFSNFPIFFKLEEEGHCSLVFSTTEDIHYSLGFCTNSFLIPLHDINAVSNCFKQLFFFEKGSPKETFEEILKHFPAIDSKHVYQNQITDNLILESKLICNERRLDPGDEFIGLDNFLTLKVNKIAISQFEHCSYSTPHSFNSCWKKINQVLQQLASPEKTPFTKEYLTHQMPLIRALAKLAHKETK